MDATVMLATLLLAAPAPQPLALGDAICNVLAAEGRDQAPVFFTTIWWEHGLDYASMSFQCSLVADRLLLRPGGLSFGLRDETVPVTIPIEAFALECVDAPAGGVKVLFVATAGDGSAVVLDYEAVVGTGEPTAHSTGPGPRVNIRGGRLYLRVAAPAFRRLEALCSGNTPCSTTRGPSWTHTGQYYEFATVADSEDQGERLAFLVHWALGATPVKTAEEVWSREPPTRLSQEKAQRLRARAMEVAKERSRLTRPGEP